MGPENFEVERRFPDLPYFDSGNSGPFPDESPVSLEDLQEMYPAVAARTKEDPAEADRARLATLELQQGRPGYRALWLFRNNADGTFSDQTESSGLADIAAYTIGLAAADYDNDGDEDFVLTNLGRNMLFRNDGGVFAQGWRHH